MCRCAYNNIYCIRSNRYIHPKLQSSFLWTNHAIHPSFQLATSIDPSFVVVVVRQERASNGPEARFGRQLLSSQVHHGCCFVRRWRRWMCQCCCCNAGWLAGRSSVIVVIPMGAIKNWTATPGHPCIGLESHHYRLCICKKLKVCVPI